MTQVQVAPPLVVWLGSSMWTFSAGKQITVGRGTSVDINVDMGGNQAISRLHMVIGADTGEWVAVDKSRNGIFVGEAKVASVRLHDDLQICLGAPHGPTLTFRTTTGAVPVSRWAPATPQAAGPPSGPLPSGGFPAQRPPTGPQPAAPAPPPPPGGPFPSGGFPAQRMPSGPQPAAPAPQHPHRPPPGYPPHRPPTGAQPAAAPQQRPPSGPQPLPVPTAGPAAPPPGAPGAGSGLDLVERVTGAVKRVLPQATPTAPPGAVTIGRSSTATIRLDDALVSRVHAYLLPAATGTQIHDNASNNGVFVNGVRVPAATLRPGDVVTIGNADLVFNGGLSLQPRVTAPQLGGLAAHQLGLTIEGHHLLTNVSFTARPGTLTAVIGPSGAGKSTLIKLLGGATRPTWGQVSFDGHNVHAQYASMRSRIGMVPQDDVVHRQLTVAQALMYAAELRLPADTTVEDRAGVVHRVLGELELLEHHAKRVDKLSGGQRKRASLALELLTGPSLLILDEPTSGLDPALDRQVMAMLRRLADAGRTVVVVTHSLTYLKMCDQVLLLAPGGKTAYAGPPGRIGEAMGTADWADIFAWVSACPDQAHAAFLARNPAAAQPPPPAAPAGPLGEPARTNTSRQVSTLARRQVRLIVADRGYLVFLAVLPFILGALSLAVPGDVGLGVASATGRSPNEPNQLLILLNIAAVFMGTALTIRDLVGERTIFRREQSVGLSAGAYLVAKIVVYSAAAALQTAIVTLIVVIGKGGPARGALMFGSPVIDLYVGLAATAIVSAIVGLVLSSLARSNEQILPMLVVVIMLGIVFSGGMIPVTGRLGLQQISWFLPARWGFAASASTIDLLTAAPLTNVDDPLWHHELQWWLLDIAVLALLGLAATALLAYRLRLPSPEVGRPGQPDSAKVAVGIVIALVVVLFVVALSVITRGGGSRSTPAVHPGGSSAPHAAAGRTALRQ